MSNAAWMNTVKKNHFHCPSQSLERIMSPYWVEIMSRSQLTMEQGPCCCLLMVGGTIMGTNVLIHQRMQAWQGAHFLLKTDLAARLGCFWVLESKTINMGLMFSEFLVVIKIYFVEISVDFKNTVSSCHWNNSSPAPNIIILISVPSLNWVIKRIKIQNLFMPTSMFL